MSHWTQSTRRQHPNSLTRRYIFIVIVSLATILLFTSPVAAQLAPAPRPGIGVDPSLPSTDPGTATPTVSQDSNTNRATITTSNTATGVPKPTVITTVTVINGTTTTLTAVITGTVGAGVAGAAGPQGTGQPAPAVYTALPKAPQSILVVQSTTYGKILPAEGPVDDQMQSHFWDQFVARPDSNSGKKSSSSLSIRFSPFMPRFSMSGGLLVAIYLLYT